MDIIYHHRTRCQGAEGVHIRGVQKSLEKYGFNIIDISIIKANDIDMGEVDLNNKKWISFICDILPNVFFKIFELLYPVLASLSGLYAIIKTKQKKEEIYFVYDRYAYFCFAMPLLCRICGIPLVLEVNTTCLDKDVRKIKFRPIAKCIEKFCMSSATVVVVVSNYLKEKIHDKYEIKNEQIVVTPNAVNPEEFHIEDQVYTRSVKLKNLSSFCRGRTIIGFVGVFVPWHGLDFLLDIFSKLSKKYNKNENTLGLLLVGDGPVRSCITDKVEKDDSLKDQVLFTGMIHHSLVKYYINLFDIAIMPDSNHFGSPMKIFEYMIMGKAVVAPNYSPIQEVITHRVNGTIFKKKDFADCYNKLSSLIENSTLRKELGNNAKKIALNNYTWDANVNKIVSALREYLSATQQK